MGSWQASEKLKETLTLPATAQGCHADDKDLEGSSKFIFLYMMYTFELTFSIDLYFDTVVLAAFLCFTCYY